MKRDKKQLLRKPANAAKTGPSASVSSTNDMFSDLLLLVEEDDNAVDNNVRATSTKVNVDDSERTSYTLRKNYFCLGGFFHPVAKTCQPCLWWVQNRYIRLPLSRWRVPLWQYPQNFTRILIDGQGTKRRRNIAKNFNCLSRAHECYRWQTERRHADRWQTIAYGEREHKFMFGKNWLRCDKIITTIVWYFFWDTV